jgi:hypothetical protein
MRSCVQLSPEVYAGKLSKVKRSRDVHPECMRDMSCDNVEKDYQLFAVANGSAVLIPAEFEEKTYEGTLCNQLERGQWKPVHARPGNGGHGRL